MMQEDISDVVDQLQEAALTDVTQAFSCVSGTSTSASYSFPTVSSDSLPATADGSFSMPAVINTSHGLAMSGPVPTVTPAATQSAQQIPSMASTPGTVGPASTASAQGAFGVMTGPGSPPSGMQPPPAVVSTPGAPPPPAFSPMGERMQMSGTGMVQGRPKQHPGVSLSAGAYNTSPVVSANTSLLGPGAMPTPPRGDTPPRAPGSYTPPQYTPAQPGVGYTSPQTAGSYTPTQQTAASYMPGQPGPSPGIYTPTQAPPAYSQYASRPTFTPPQGPPGFNPAQGPGSYSPGGEGPVLTSSAAPNIDTASVDLDSSGPSGPSPGGPVILEDPMVSGSGGLFSGIFSQYAGNFMDKVVKKTKVLSENVITALDPGMRQIMSPVGLEVVLASDRHTDSIKRAFHDVFGRADVYTLPPPSSPALDAPVAGFAAAVSAAGDTVDHISQYLTSQLSRAGDHGPNPWATASGAPRVTAATQSFTAELTPRRFFLLHCIVLQHQQTSITSFSLPIPLSDPAAPPPPDDQVVKRMGLSEAQIVQQAVRVAAGELAEKIQGPSSQ